MSATPEQRTLLAASVVLDNPEHVTPLVAACRTFLLIRPAYCAFVAQLLTDPKMYQIAYSRHLQTPDRIERVRFGTDSLIPTVTILFSRT